MGGGRGGALRLYAPPSYATLRAALGIETDLVAMLMRILLLFTVGIRNRH